MPRLRRVNPDSPGWTRRRQGKGFVYLDEELRALGADDAARCRSLVIPPAWTQVWICPAPNGHIQAVGVDDAGRRQYLYHPVWRERQDAEKFERMTALASALPSARLSVARDLEAPELTRARVLAAAFLTLDLGGIRIGSEESLAGFRSRGLTTLLVRNARLEDDDVVRF